MAEQLKEYPTDRIVAIAADQDIADAVAQAVAGATARSTDVEVIDPSEREQATTEGDGGADDVLGIVRRIFGDETTHLERFSQALQAGGSIVSVSVRDADQLSDDEHEQVREDIAEAMTAAGATEVTYFGRWTIEQKGQRP